MACPRMKPVVRMLFIMSMIILVTVMNVRMVKKLGAARETCMEASSTQPRVNHQSVIEQGIKAEKRPDGIRDIVKRLSNTAYEKVVSSTVVADNPVESLSDIWIGSRQESKFESHFR